ncbi:MAG: zinc ribbon domain-containing protein [Christensenellaceae bacterium]|nr:zinc ribbon domain-containing protein [Christensenellaceae bacterium]
MPFCTNCGYKIQNGSKYCTSCGTAVSSEKIINQRKSVFEGNIYKCPNCGDTLGSFVSHCSSCGYEVRGVSNSYAVKEFAEKLAEAENHQKKVTIIRNFPIPNTKEDILEFMILASTNVGRNLESDLSVAWQTKIEQAYEKAEIILENKKEFLRIQKIYTQVCSKLNKKKKVEKGKNVRNFISELMSVLINVIVVTGWLISIFALMPLCDESLGNANAMSYQLFILIDFVIGAILIPFALRCESHLPKLITLFGLGLSIVILISLNEKNSNNYGVNIYNLILLVDIICSGIILIRMFINIKKGGNIKTPLSWGSFVVALICVALMLIVYRNGYINIPKQVVNPVSPTIDVSSVTNNSEGIYSYKVRNYIGKNVASIGKYWIGTQTDQYGAGELNIIFVTESGMIIPLNDDEFKKQYTVVEQSIPVGKNLTIVNQRDSNGKPYSYLVDYQSYDEILLYVAPIGTTSYVPTITELLPTLDRHIYHVKDYVGRNAASFGKAQIGKRIDEYGAGELRIIFTAEDGTFVDASDINILKKYIVVEQDIAPNKELKLEYEKDSSGIEYDYLIRYQNFEEINLTVKKIDESIVSQMPILDYSVNR